MAHNVTLIRGDGTGPELVEAAKKVLDATGVGFNWDVVEAGVDIMETAGTPLPPNVLESIRKNKVALKGPITTPIGSGFPLGQRGAAQRTGSLRLHPALQILSRHPLQVPGRGSCRRAREHGRPVRGRGVRCAFGGSEADH